MSIARPLLHYELCHTSYVPYKQYRNTLESDIYELLMLLAVITSDLIASFVRGLTVRLATATWPCMHVHHTVAT